jgi:Mrp family chromosome partitioning ATPase
VTDAVVLSLNADGVIVVVKAGKTLRDDVSRSVRQVTAVGRPVIGVILNELDLEERHGYAYYSYYAAYGKDASEQEAAS